MKSIEAEIHYNPDLTQIINGEEVMSPSPKADHEFIQGELSFLLKAHVKAEGLGRICNAPLDIVFDDGTDRLQPDIMYITKANLHIIQDWVRGIPELVVEIVSPGSFKMDTVTKKKLYEYYGVPELWLVFPKRTTIEVFTLVENKYELLASYRAGQRFKSPSFPKLSFPVTSIFE